MSNITGNPFDKQIKNRNFLSAVGFKFTIVRSPKVAFFGNSINIPSLQFGVSEVASYLRDIPFPGDKIEFEDLTVRFLVDEDLSNYMEIQKWIRGLGYPESLEETYNYQKQKGDFADTKGQLNLYSDATLLVLNSSQNLNFKVEFSDIFPISLSTLTFDATDTDIEYFTAEATFKYTMYNIVNTLNKPL